MKLFQAEHTFPHNWSLLTRATWQKYPSELSSQVLTCDVIRRSTTPTTIVTERLLAVTNSSTGPAWVRRLLPIPDVAYFHETSTLDLGTREYTAVSRNLSMTGFLTLEETIVLRPGDRTEEEDGMRETTRFTQSAVVSAAGILTLAARLIEEGAVRSFETNAARGRAATQAVVDALVEEAGEVRERIDRGFAAGSAGLRA
ncbi:PRELI domain containing protein 3A [Thoreauomyces humboldtii]|nr:PRELI domain containing protein 3A [Thoreauomyces humboldtii]